MGFSGARRAVLVATLVALAIAGSAAAQESERGIDPNQGRSLVEVNLPDKAAAIELQLEADDYGIDFNDHYLRTNADGSVTVTVFGNGGRVAGARSRRLRARHDDRRPGHLAPARRGLAGRREGREDRRGGRARRRASAEVAPRGDIVVLRVDYFENYAGRFLSVEAKDGTRGSAPPPESRSWSRGIPAQARRSIRARAR